MAPTDIVTPMSATIVEITVAKGAAIRKRQVVVIVEAMKMEHEIRCHHDGVVVEVCVVAGDVVEEGAVLLRVASHDHAQLSIADGRERVALPAIDRTSANAAMRADLSTTLARHALTQDDARPDAIAKRHALGLRSARDNIARLCDAGSFIEYGALAVAAQSRRRNADDLMRNTPADGMVTGIATINGALIEDAVDETSKACGTRCVVMAYDATVLAGTQGFRNHQKTDRMLVIAYQQRLPVVLFAEGGGGRPGDVDMAIVAGLHVPTFASYARLSGRVPIVAIVAGRCFAGNAALAGCSDVIIATRNSNLGMGGPAMIEGGGLGRFAPEEIGPAAVHATQGSIDVLVDDEAEAVEVAKRYLGFFQGRLARWSVGDQSVLRDALPENRVRAYDVRKLVDALVDIDSLLELRAQFGAAILTMLARIEGRAVGLIVSNSTVQGGAIDADAADKAARFMQLCDAHGVPLVSLIDTPGFMVGPEIEARAQVRHVSRMFVTGAQLRVPFFAVILRKGYGLGAMAMTAGGFHAPLATVAWPTGEFGAMGLEGAVKLGYRKELEAAPDDDARDALHAKLVAEHYERGGALNMAATLEIDAVIDPAETRAWLALGLASASLHKREPRHDGERRFVDPW